jgi:hypothetical protein
LPPGAGDPDRLLPPLLDVLGVLPPDDAFRTVDPAPRRQRTHDALRQVFVAASVAQPLCLIVEDLHWIDVETQTVLDRLVDSIPAARVLLVVNYRPEYQHRWTNKTHYVQLGLDVLATESVGELLDALLGEDPGLAPLKKLLADHGNPFFLEETVQTLVETKALEGARGRYRLTQPVQATEVPPTVHAVLAARIDRLPPEEKALIQCAAVIGKDVPFALLQEVVAVDRPGAIVVTEAVAPFVTRGFVLERLRDAERPAWVLLRREKAPVALTRLVGRAAELVLLQQASARAVAGPRADRQHRRGGGGREIAAPARNRTGAPRLARPVRRGRRLRHDHVLFPARGGAQELLPRPGLGYRGRGAGARRALSAARGR